MPASALSPLQLAAAALRPALTVAGHESAAGAPLSAAGGLFLKPLPDGDARAARELAFYSRFSASALRPFLPAFMGVASLPAAAPAPPRRFLTLQDQCAALRRPCLADVKLGFRTSDAALCGPAHAAKCGAKDESSTSAALGVRLAGAQAWERAERGGWALWRPGREACRALDADGLSAALRRLLSAGEGDPGRSRRGAALAAQARAAAAALAAVPGLRLLSASALLLFDAESNESNGSSDEPRLRLIDFAHAFAAEESGAAGVDENAAAALRSLARLLDVAAAAERA